jgi:3'-phosphoadenosine 5'-phosphosulfate sulfotransferase (PAPS reductase)/FAD synthetase
MAHPFPLFEQIWPPTREVLVTPEITSALEVGAAVAIGVSGGKDSAATALATIDYLEDAGHRGPRVLIHSDLGRVEWRQSLPACQRLAVRLGLELMVVRRETGDLVDRWRLRWENNVRRYAQLSCVKLILPWSTASMRFCTSELKTSIICRALVQRFPGQTILSATGIRRQESPNRAKAPVAKQQPKLASASRSPSEKSSFVATLHPVSTSPVGVSWMLSRRTDGRRRAITSRSVRISTNTAFRMTPLLLIAEPVTLEDVMR